MTWDVLNTIQVGDLSASKDNATYILDTKGKILAFIEPPQQTELTNNGLLSNSSGNSSSTNPPKIQSAPPIVVVNSNFSWNVLTAVTQGDLSNTPSNNSYTVDNKGKLLQNNTATTQTSNPPSNISQPKINNTNSTNSVVPKPNQIVTPVKTDFQWGVSTEVVRGDAATQITPDNLVLNSSGAVIQNNTTPKPAPVQQPKVNSSTPIASNTTPKNNTSLVQPKPITTVASDFQWGVSTEVIRGDIATQITPDNLVLNNSGAIIQNNTTPKPKPVEPQKTNSTTTNQTPP